MAFMDRYDNGSWHIESELGIGGYGKVYKISKVEFGFKSYSALKVIPVPQSSLEIDRIYL
jgi:hypothetical protein